MKSYFIISLILVTTSCSLKEPTYDVLNDVICDALGKSYRYESYRNFCERTDTSGVDTEFYKANRIEKPSGERYIFFAENLTRLDIDSTFRKDKYLNARELMLFEKLRETTESLALDLNQIRIGCGYIFKLTIDEEISKIRPSERVFFRLSNVSFNKTLDSACFFIEGGRGASGYWDSIIFVQKDNKTWKIINKVPIGIY